MSRWLFVPILAGVGVGCFAYLSMGMTMEGILLYTGWALVLSVVALLALYRIALVRNDRRARAEGMPPTHTLHLVLQHQESTVDHIGIPLTVGTLLYTIGLLIFTVSALIDNALRKTLTLFALH